MERSTLPLEMPCHSSWAPYQAGQAVKSELEEEEELGAKKPLYSSGSLSGHKAEKGESEISDQLP